MQSLLPYLKDIADALKRMVGLGSDTSASGGSATNSSVRVTNNVDTESISDKITGALVETVEVDDDEVQKSVFETVGNEAVELLHEALFITVEEEEGGQTVDVEKSIFEVIYDDITAI